MFVYHHRFVYLFCLLVSVKGMDRNKSEDTDINDPWYCGLRYRRLCQGKGRHIACQFPIPGPGGSCQNYTKITFDTKLRYFVLHYVNRRRQRIASGNEMAKGGVPIPKPRVMMQVEWDKELAMLAQRLADQCNFVHDECRATVRYPYAGQSVGEVRWRREAGETARHGANIALRRVLDAWWGERRRVTVTQLTQPFTLTSKGNVWGHFTQLAVWSLQAMGCGMVRHGSERPRILLVCDFSHTNMLGQRTLIPGELAPCPIHTARRVRSQYPLLCAAVSSSNSAHEILEGPDLEYEELEYEEDYQDKDGSLNKTMDDHCQQNKGREKDRPETTSLPRKKDMRDDTPKNKDFIRPITKPIYKVSPHHEDTFKEVKWPVHWEAERRMSGEDNTRNKLTEKLTHLYLGRHTPSDITNNESVMQRNNNFNRMPSMLDDREQDTKADHEDKNQASLFKTVVRPIGEGEFVQRTSTVTRIFKTKLSENQKDQHADFDLAYEPVTQRWRPPEWNPPTVRLLGSGTRNQLQRKGFEENAIHPGIRRTTTTQLLRSSRPGAKALLLKVPPLVVVPVAPKKETHVTRSSLTMAKDDIEQLYKDTGFKLVKEPKENGKDQERNS